MGKSKRSRDAAESEEKAFDWGIDIPAKKRKTDDDATAADAGATEVKKSKKDKKDKKDKYKKESRKEKKDKRKNLQSLPDEDAIEDEDMERPNAESQPEPEPEVKKEKKKSKKEDKAEKTAEVNGDEQSKKDQKKKDKKAKKEAKKSEPSTEPTATTDSSNASPNGIDLSPSDAQKQDRHIVFVGNLPFSATAASISAHFASLEPVAVRCMKNKDDDKPCKGFAFVEFGKVWHMRTCLDKFHHSSFDDGVSPARKINVELTAGGGGKTKLRLEKIKAKNVKLNENRAKRIENEKTTKKDGGEEEKKQPSNGGIHPSRLARLPGLGQ